MLLLLDENLPKRLKQDFPEHEIFTVWDKGWSSKKNGELLVLMLAEHFDVLLTFDKNMKYQQNFNKYSIPVFVLMAEDNSYLCLSPLVPKIKEALSAELKIGVVEIKL